MEISDSRPVSENGVNRIGRAWTRLLGICVALVFPVAPLPAAYYPNLSFGTKQELVPGVTWQTVTHTNPRWSIQVFEVDMANPNVAVIPVFKSAGNVSSGNQRTSTMATRVDAVAAINAGYYASNLLTNSYTMISGQFIGGAGSNMRPEGGRSVLGFSAFPQQDIVKRTKLSSSFVPADPVNWDKITDAIGGRGHFVTADGMVVTQDNESTTEAHHSSRHPRTVIGYSLNPDRVWLVTVDGRHTSSVGMTYTELARLMADLGVAQSISLDGGGSTTAWVRGRGVVNRLSDGSERAVVSAWAVVQVSYSSRFSAGDWVRTTATANLNLRSGPGTSFPVVSSFPFGTTAVIRADGGNGVRADGHNWWFVKVYPGGTEGWWAEAYLDATEPPEFPTLQIAPGATGKTIKISWKSIAGASYRLQRSEDLKTWSDLGNSIIGSGAEVVYEDEAEFDTRGFYRLMSEY